MVTAGLNIAYSRPENYLEMLGTVMKLNIKYSISSCEIS